MALHRDSGHQMSGNFVPACQQWGQRLKIFGYRAGLSSVFCAGLG